MLRITIDGAGAAFLFSYDPRQDGALRALTANPSSPNGDASNC